MRGRVGLVVAASFILGACSSLEFKPDGLAASLLGSLPGFDAEVQPAEASAGVEPGSDEFASALLAHVSRESLVEISFSDNELALMDEVVRLALEQEGVRYRNGGVSPERGFDCSGLINYVYASQGVELPRTSHELAVSLPEVSKAELRPGDLVFFRINSRPFSHAGIYVGDDRFVHASSTRTGRVMVSSMEQRYWKRRFLGARRPLERDQQLALKP